MRFIANGPWIPDDLLLARDQGRVVFFCGAGVSRARANLPDFFELARRVIKALGVTEDSAAQVLLKEAAEIEKRTGLPGLISADRIFGILERDFDQRDIESAVAAALKPTPGCDVSAHSLLLDLATTTDGKVQLVTTNFDLLFEDARTNIPAWQPPRLPSPSRHAEMNGVVYLHGRASPAYDGAGESRFVLSSAEFGRAYLSEAWATTFIREILANYVVVFIGYSADDPPVHYLLEAMSKASQHSGNAYAFQVEGANDASAKWVHKGVEAILYSEENRHQALWETIECWAARARDSEQWYRQTIAKAQSGPSALAPFERGQIAHIASTAEGMKRFNAAEEVPPAEWLCVFDRYRRFARPGYTGNYLERDEYLDPFDLFGLDQDVPPAKIGPDDSAIKREIPDETWDGFSLNKFDRTAPSDSNFSAVRGHWAVNMPVLTPRLREMCIWIARVADQPAAVWWAARQHAVHPDLRKWIKWELEKKTGETRQEVLRAWNYLFEIWEQREASQIHESSQFEKIVKELGWGTDMVRRYTHLCRPRLEIEDSHWFGIHPPPKDVKLSAAELVQRYVFYPERLDSLSIPDAWVSKITRALRENLEEARTLEIELDGYGLTDFAPIHPEARKGNPHDVARGLSAAVLEFASMFARLLRLDSSAARQEYSAWPSPDDTIFLRLRLWAAHDATLVSDSEFCNLMLEIDVSAFWSHYHQPDLLSVLASRWNGLSPTRQKAIEGRLVCGPEKWDDESDEKYEARRAWHVLERLHWLFSKGCKPSFELEKFTESLLPHVPDWNPSQATRATEPSVRGGWVKTHTDPSELLGIPVSGIIAKAQQLSEANTDFLNRNDPFSGLVVSRPYRAFLALAVAGKSDDYPVSAWQKFLSSESRKEDSERLITTTCARLCRLPDEVLLKLLRPASQWILAIAEKLSKSGSTQFDSLFQKLVAQIRRHPMQGGSGIVRGRNAPDWIMEAINSPSGKLAQSLFEALPQNFNPSTGFPPSWISNVESLLALEDDARRYALNLFSTNLSWFFHVDSTWTEKALISVLENGDLDDRNAVMTGLLRSGRAPTFALYSRLKPMLLSFASKPFSDRSSHHEMLASVILSGWGTIDTRTNERCVSDEEMRRVLLDADEKFRLRILWQASNWAKTEDGWRSLVPKLIADVWPRQTSVRSAEISAQLLNLLFSNEEWFPKIVEATLRLLTKVSSVQHISSLIKPRQTIIEQFPAEAIAILDAALPDDASDWPYGVDATIRTIGDAHLSIRTDHRFIRLTRVLNTR